MPGFMPAMIPSDPSATASTSGGSGSEEKVTSQWPASARRIICPGWARIEMMAGGLSLQVMDDQFVPGLLQVGGHAPAHDAQSDKSSLAISNLIS